MSEIDINIKSGESDGGWDVIEVYDGEELLCVLPKPLCWEGDNHIKGMYHLAFRAAVKHGEINYLNEQRKILGMEPLKRLP